MKKKKFALICCAIVVSLMLISLVLILTRKKPTYTLENVHFNQVVSYNGDLDLNNLSIIKKQGGKVERIIITPDMIVSGGETNSIGTRSVVIQYENQTFSIDITVKYKVEFVVNGVVVSSQYVIDENEIVYPNDPELDGCEFIDWESTTYVVNDNTVFYAKFKLNNPLKTFKYDATFGDTLADFKLPKNEYGEWKFIDDLSTSVGDAQTTYKNFDIEFVPYDLDCIQRETGVAQIKVKKKELQFKNVSTSFYYDSNVKSPTFEIDKDEDSNLNIDKVQIDYIPYYSGDAVNAGVYSFNLYVNDPNFSGRYNGSFEIKKVVAKVIVGSFEIGLNDEYPENFPYVVQDANGELLDEELVNLMNIQIIKPYYQHANKYEIGATVNNSNFDWSVESGCLTVNKVELDLDSTPPTFVNGKKIEYGSLLESVEFVNDDVRGTWIWEDPTIKILTPSAYVAKAKFIPFETGDYLISSKEITLEVQKKELKIEILNNKYVYDGSNHNVQYNVVGLVDKDEAVIVGNISQKTAGNYDVKLSVDENDLRYIGATSTSLIIEQKSISDFPQGYSKEWNGTLKLEDIDLPAGYAWVEPLTPLTDIGEQSYLVQFTPEDEVNYKTEKDFVKVDVYKATAVIESPSLYEFEYNPNGYSLNAINLPHSEAELKIEYKINGNVVENLSSVGEYEVELTLEESEHYNKISKKVSVVINKFKNTDVVVLNQTATYEDLLSKFSLPNNSFGKWQWKDGADSQVGVVGNHVHVAEYVPNDLVNYESREVEVNFEVLKKEITLPTIQSKVFNNQTQVANISNTKYYNVVENKGGVNKGSYDVVVELNDFDNYCWNGDAKDLKQVTLSFEILKNTTNAWVQTPSISSWKYGELAKTPIGKALYGNINVEYKSVNSSEYSKDVPTKAGSYVARFSVAETENYIGLDAIVYEFNIDYIVVPVPSIASKTYNGEGQNATISETAHYSVTSNEEHVNAGEYDVVLTLKNDSYKWPDSYDLNKTLTFVINKVENKDVVPSLFEATYKDALSKFELPKNNTGVWGWENGSEAEVGDAGIQIHKIVFTPHDKTNFMERVENVEIKVAKKIVQQPTFAGKTFNGENQIAEVSESDDYIIVENNGGKEAGKYDVVFQLKDPSNYRWAVIDENESELTLLFEILKNEANKWEQNPSISGWTYGQDKSTPVASSTFGDVVVEYKLKSEADSEYSEVKPVNAGDYVARFTVAGCDSYSGLTKLVEFRIEYVVVPLPSIASKVFNGAEQLAEIAQDDRYSILTECLQYKNAGKYEIVIKLNNENYKWTDSYNLERTIIFEIKKVENKDVVILTRQAEYGDMLKDEYLPTSDYGVWQWVNKTTVGDVGSQNHVAKFVPSDPINYETREVTVTFEVAKKVIQKPVFDGATYNGSLQIANVSSNEIYEVIENNGGIEKGEYDVVFSLIHPESYRWAGTDENEPVLTMKFKIGMVANSWIVYPSIIGWKYGATQNNPVAESLYGDVIIEYKLKSEDDSKYSEVKPTNAGVYVARFSVEETESYNGLEATVEFKIDHIVVSVPQIANKVYNGSAQTADVPEQDYYDVVSNVERINAGEYDVVIKLNNVNYKWPDTFETEKTLTFIIEKVKNEDVVILTRQAEYGDMLKDEYLPTSDYGDWQWVNKTTVGDVGSQNHVAKFVPSDPINYETREVTVTFDVSKKLIQKPVFDNATYNENLQVANVSSNEIYEVVENNGGIEKGEYDVVFRLLHPESYRWAGIDENEPVLTMKFRISSTANNTWKVAPSIVGWKYGETPNNPTGESLFGEVVVEYKLKTEDDSKYSEVKPVSAGVFTARFSVAETESYNELEATVEFKIDHIVVSVPEIGNKVYNGSAQKADIPEKDYYDVVSNAGKINAGEYDVVIKLNNVNYKWPDTFETEKTLTFIIEKVKNEDEFDVYNAVYGDKLSDHELIENNNGEWTWKTGEETLVGIVGTQSHVAVFTPYDETNYEGREVAITFNVSKKQLLTPEVEAKEYNGEEQLPEIEESTLYSVNYATPGTEKGEYDVQFRLTDSDNYEWKSNTNSETIIVKFNILKSNGNKWVEGNKPSMVGWKYGETPNNPTGESLFGKVVVEYKLKSEDDSKYSEVKPVSAGVYTARFSVEETESYNGLEATVEFKIDHIVVSVPEIENKVYNGSAQKADVPEQDYYDVVSNAGKINAGEYDVVIKLNNVNYKWPDTYETEKTLTFIIEKVKNEDEFDVYNAVYGDKLSDHELIENNNGEWTWKTGEETLVGIVGTQSHVAVFTPYDETNYEGREVTITFNVSKKQLLTPEVEAKEYNGEEQLPEIEESTLYSIDYATPGTEKGEYNVQFRLTDSDNYEWKSNTNSETIIVKFNILKSNGNKWVEGSEPSMVGWKYGETQNDPTGESLFGEVVVEYRSTSESDDKYSTVKPSKAGSYLARFSVAETESFNGLSYVVVEFEIEYVVVSEPTIINKTYNGENQKADILESEYYDIVLNEEHLNAGQYEVKVKLNNDSYKWPNSYELEKSLTFVINKVKNEDVIEAYNAEYTDSLASLKLITNPTGVWSWKSGNETLVGEVGNQIHVAVFTPYDATNYEAREVEVVVNVDKKAIEAPTATAKVFNNENQTAGLESTDLYQVVSEEGFNVGEYNVELTIVDFNHYCWKNDNLNQTTTIKFNIIKNNNNDWDGDDPSISGWTYFKEQPNAPTGKAIFGDLIAEYKLQSEDDSKYSQTRPENVGSYVARFSVADCDNYNGLDYVYSNFVVEYCEVGVPTFASKEYNGKQQKADIATADEYKIIKNELQINAGKYEVIVELINSNFKWVDSYDLEKKLTFEITKSDDNVWLNNGPTMNSFTYTPTYNSSNEASATSLFGAVQIKYLKDGVYLNELPTNVGTYTAEFKVLETDNYNGLSKTIDFNITQATPTVSGLQISTVAYENSCKSVIEDSLSVDVAGEIEFDMPKLETTSKSAYSQATYLVDFTPADTHNYKTLTDVQGTINLYSVCYSGSTYYGSIENALSKVTSGTVTVIPNASRDVAIVKNVTIPSKVTLSLPYLAENGSYSVNNTNGKATLHLDAGSSETDKANAVGHTSDLKLTTRVVIKNGVTLTNNGTLMIAGETSGGRGGSGLAGHTARNFAEIEMEPNAKIISNGTIHCFGFIDVSDLNDASSQVLIQSGTLYMPFVVADFRGGTFMKNAYQDLKVSPFNQFELRNIIASLRINQGAKLIGHGNLYAQTLSSYIGGLLGGLFGGGSSSKSDNNYAEVKLIGNDQNYLIQLTSGGYVEGKYNPIRESVDNNNQWTDGINNLNFYGGAKTNSLKMKVVSVTLDTSTVAFPLSWRFKIGLNNGSYSMGNTFKMMPGAELTVQKGATLTVDTLNVYRADWNDTMEISDESTYKTNAGAPKLIVRGTLISNSALGGIVYSDTNDAVVQVKSSNSASTKEIVSKTGDTFNASDFSNSLCLKSATNIDEAISTGTFASSVDGESSSTYKMVNGVWVKQ